MTDIVTDIAALQKTWRKNLEDLPATPEKIPVFFFGHGTPILEFPASNDGGVMQWAGSAGPLAKFLKDFGPALLKKYQPKGIVVFSAHWETTAERLVTDYDDENPLLFDYYGFQPELYELKFKSKGDSTLSSRVVELYKESRGSDGRGFSGMSPRTSGNQALVDLPPNIGQTSAQSSPGPGFDHGVFVPFRIMFGEELTDVPIVQVSIDSSLSPETHWALGKAVAKLREEGILVLSGGLVAHNLDDRGSFAPQTANPLHKEFDRATVAAVSVVDGAERKKAMVNLTKHSGFRACHPREDHFVPLYVAAGAGEGGYSKVIADIYGGETVAFGL
ncbi:Extradiol ring-cleavage dioxygenase class III enzyme subunit B [Mycena rosella]|uniref:Extradiol ring-cleavage dioxygenase class III enzyme subunit B n=1 Tax=Mycena rosella TaxID=1033263 RepID=A0AAD7GR96_MYCRO|nr:Extradiol ring-cleavage dioxygenase class III enzyme subunit B [Mycena rosella]